MTDLYGIAEWYGEAFAEMAPSRRMELARIALGRGPDPPPCPFQSGRPPCRKRGGVCSIQRYERLPELGGARVGRRTGGPVIVCPQRFEEGNTVPKWLADVVGFNASKSFIAREVPFMRSPSTGQRAGQIDIVLADGREDFKWFGLEIQAVYFSGTGMPKEFERLAKDANERPPYPDSVRRPDWRSSSAKRLMPQLQVKAPTLRRWGTKLAVSVDMPFFEAMGGSSREPSHDLDEGDIIWLVVEVSEKYKLKARHWEVLSLEDSSKKLLAAKPIRRQEFEPLLRSKLMPLEGTS